MPVDTLKGVPKGLPLKEKGGFMGLLMSLSGPGEPGLWQLTHPPQCGHTMGAAVQASA